MNEGLGELRCRRHFLAINYLKYVWIANFGTEYNREQIPWAGGEYPAQAVQTF